MENQKVKLVGKFEKSAIQEVRISLKEWKDKRYIDFRIFVLSDQGEIVPTKRGVSIPFEKFDELKEIFGKIEEAIKSF